MHIFKKNKEIILAVVVGFILGVAGFGGVSEKEYNTVVNELNKSKETINELERKIKEVKPYSDM